MRKLGIIVIMAVTVAAYRDSRKTSAISSFDDFPPYQESHQHPALHEQHEPLRDQSFRPQGYQFYREQPYRRDASYPQQSSFKDQSFLRDHSWFKNRPLEDDTSYFRHNTSFKKQPTFYLNRGSFTDQEYRNTVPFKGGQSLEDNSRYSSDKYTQQPQSYNDNYRHFSNFAQSYPDESYEKPDNYYNLKKESFNEYSDYLKYGNHGLGFASVPTSSPYETALPLSDEVSTTVKPSTAPTHKTLLQSTVSSTTSPTTQVYTSASSDSKMVSAKSLSSSTTQNMKSDTQPDVLATTASTHAASTIPTVPTSVKQSSDLGHSSPTASTTVNSLPVAVTQTPVISFGGKLSPIQFQTTKFNSGEVPSTFYLPSDLKSKIQQSVVNQLFLDETRNSLKSNIQNEAVNYVLSDIPDNSLNSKIQNAVLNYILPDESKNIMKGSVESSLLSYLLQQEPKRGLSFQQSSLPETVNYVPLTTLPERPKLTLPSIPIATLSAVSRPAQTINYVPTTLPKVSFMTPDSQSRLTLGTSLSSELPLNVPQTRPTSIFNSLPAGLATGISSGIPGSMSTGMPGSMSTGIPASLPTWNYGQNFQPLGQIRQFVTPRSQAYSPGLQLQLGGFGGIDYTLHSSNPAPRPMELGIAKVGLSLPELPRPHVPTFAKIKFGEQLW